MFRWIQPRVAHNHPSSKSPDLLTDLRQHVSHAFAPIFRYTPSHPIRECPYCFEKIRHRGMYIKDKVPLEYQENVFTSTQITRYSINVGLSYEGRLDHETLPHAEIDCRSMQEACKDNMGCKVNRILLDKADFIAPTRYNIEQEITQVLSHMKINDHVIIYFNGHSQGASHRMDELVTSDGRLIADDDVMNWLDTPENHVYVWIIADVLHGPSFLDFPVQYKYNPVSDSVVSYKRPHEKNKVRLHYLSYVCECSGEHKGGNLLTKTFLHVMRKRRFRLSVNRLLKELYQQMQESSPGHYPVFMTNYPMNTKKTYFGFG